jgi:hypothetical protein
VLSVFYLNNNKIVQGTFIEKMNFMRSKYLILGLILLTFNFPLFSQIGGTSTFNFLELPVSARAAALGDNFVAVRDGDISLAASNPAVLDSTLSNHAVLSYIPYFAGIDYGYFAVAHTIKGFGLFGQTGTVEAAIKYVNYGTFQQADFAGNLTGTFTANEYLYNIGYGQPLKDSTVTMGVNFKGISSHLQQYSSNGFALDLAASYVSPNKRLYMGAVIQNIGSQIKEYTAGVYEPLPFNALFGLSYKLAHAPFRFGVTIDHLQKFDLTYLDPTDSATVNPLTQQAIPQNTVGDFADKLMRHVTPNLEIVLGKNFMLRIAYNYEMRKELELSNHPGMVGFSGGFGIKIYKFQLSYSMAGYDLGVVQSTFSMVLALNDFYTRRS